MPGATSGHPHVLILGAGLGGLALAQALRKKGVTFEIFERDESAHSRHPGWAIALHWMLQDLHSSVPDDMPDIGVTHHLQPLELPAQFCYYEPDTAERTLCIESFDPRRMVRANRSRLRDWLATHIGEHIHWGKIVSRIEDDDSSVTLQFSDGTSATGDVLVGADGVRSVVRRHLLGAKQSLRNIPLGQVMGEVILNKEQYEKQLAIAHSAYVTTGPGFRLFVGCDSVSQDKSSSKWYWGVGWPDPEAENEPYWTTMATRQELYEKALEVIKPVHPKLSEIIHLSGPETIVQPLPISRDLHLEHLPNTRITLLGDAAHAMTPARGDGGNHAIKDALNLARAIAGSEPETLLPALKEYQDEMLKRGGVAVEQSRAASLADSGEGTRAAWSLWRDAVASPQELQISA